MLWLRDVSLDVSGVTKMADVQNAILLRRKPTRKKREHKKPTTIALSDLESVL